MRREPIKYTYDDYKLAQAKLERARGDFELRQKSMVLYRAEVISAQALVETIKASMEQQRDRGLMPEIPDF